MSPFGKIVTTMIALRDPETFIPHGRQPPRTCSGPAGPHRYHDCDLRHASRASASPPRWRPRVAPTASPWRPLTRNVASPVGHDPPRHVRPVVIEPGESPSPGAIGGLLGSRPRRGRRPPSPMAGSGAGQGCPDRRASWAPPAGTGYGSVQDEERVRPRSSGVAASTGDAPHAWYRRSWTGDRDRSYFVAGTANDITVYNAR